MNSLDAVIVGAGPAGSACATHLARAGWRVLVVDRATFPREKACSEYMSPETARLLRDLGVLPGLRAEGAVPLTGSSVRSAGGAQLSGAFTAAHGIAIARRDLDHSLLAAARRAGAAVEEGMACRGLLVEHGRVAGVHLAALGGVRTLRAGLVVGADGLRSIVARDLGGFRRSWPARHAFVAHVADVPGMGDAAEMHVSSAGYVGLNPIGRGLTNVALVVPSRLLHAAAGRVQPFFIEQLKRFPGVAGRVRAECIVRKVMATGPFAQRATRVTAPGALLVGDAADFFDPFTGEGIGAALRGAELIARHVAPLRDSSRPVTPRDESRALRAYRLARGRAFAGKWMVERLVGYAMESPGLFDHAVARIGRRRGMADTMIGVTGAVLPARRVLNPWYLARMVL